MVNWNGIKYFVHVAEVGNVSTAASELNIVQPALSRHIRRLEEEVGAQLFHRLPRGMQLTDEGRLFLERCRRMMREFALAKQDLATGRTSPSGHVSFGTPGTLARTLVPRLLNRMRARYPNVFVRIKEGASLVLQDKLISGRLHATILSNPTSVAGVHITPLVAEQLVIVAPQSHVRPRSYYTLNELAQTPVIVAAYMREMVDQQIRAAGKKLLVEFEVNSVEAIRSIVLSGSGLTILPVSTLRDEAEKGLVTTFPVSDINIHRTLAMAHRTGDLPPAVQAVIDVAQSEIGELAAQGAFTAPPDAPTSRPAPGKRGPEGKKRRKIAPSVVAGA